MQLFFGDPRHWFVGRGISEASLFRGSIWFPGGGRVQGNGLPCSSSVAW